MRIINKEINKEILFAYTNQWSIYRLPTSLLPTVRLRKLLPTTGLSTFAHKYNIKVKFCKKIICAFKAENLF